MNQEYLLQLINIAEKLAAATDWCNACYGDASPIASMLSAINEDLSKLNHDLMEGGHE